MTQNGPNTSSSRTVLLVVIALLALALLIVAGFLVFRSGDRATSSSEGTGSSTTTNSEAPSSTESSTSSKAPTSTPDRTRPTAAPGSVTYQFTGSGSVVAVGYTSADGNQVVAAAGAPWSVRTTVRGGSAELTAIVVSGTVTCTILHGEDLLASSTSSGGPLACRAQVPS